MCAPVVNIPCIGPILLPVAVAGAGLYLLIKSALKVGKGLQCSLSSAPDLSAWLTIQ